MLDTLFAIQMPTYNLYTRLPGGIEAESFHSFSLKNGPLSPAEECMTPLNHSVLWSFLALLVLAILTPIRAKPLHPQYSSHHSKSYYTSSLVMDHTNPKVE